MSLKKLSHRSESLLNIILNNLIKEGRWIEGRPWVSITQKALAKILKCTDDCISLHVCRLVKEGVLLRKKLSDKEDDRRNHYSVNAEILNNSALMSFFNKTIAKKIRAIYKVRNITPLELYISNQQTSQSELGSDMSIVFPKGNSANPPAAERNTTANDMLGIWNSELGADELMTKSRARYLVACYQRKFDSSLEKWTDYVLKLKNSKFVKSLRKRLKSLLKWALSFKVINCVFKGGFGTALKEALNTKMKDVLEVEKQAKEKQPNVSTAEDHINSLSELESCLETRRLVVEKFGESAYMSWFTKIRLEERDGEILVTGSSFIVERIKLSFLRGERFIENPIYEYEVVVVGDRNEQEELIAEGYIGRDRMRAALFGG